MVAPQYSARFLDAVEAIYAAAPAPALWPQTLEKIAAAFGEVAANLFYIRDDGSFGMVITPSLADVQRDYDREWWRHDIRTIRAIEYGYADGVEAITDRHVASEQEIREHPFYRDFARPHGFGWFAGVSISPDPGTTLAISVHRSAAAKPPFDDDELAALTRLGRHAENALRLSARLLTAELTGLAFGEALARLDVGVFLIDSSGAVRVANPVGQGLIGDSLIISEGRLAARSDPGRTELQASIQAILGHQFRDAEPVPRPVILRGVASEDYAVAYVLPVRSMRDHPFEQALLDAHALVVVRPAKRAEPVDPSLVRDLLCVTLGEARVAALIGAGFQPREVAAKLGIAEGTARNVLKRVFAKAGVSRQSDLAGLLSRLVLR